MSAGCPHRHPSALLLLLRPLLAVWPSPVCLQHYYAGRFRLLRGWRLLHAFLGWLLLLAACFCLGFARPLLLLLLLLLGVAAPTTGGIILLITAAGGHATPTSRALVVGGTGQALLAVQGDGEPHGMYCHGI
jgi:hypothetical protein